MKFIDPIISFSTIKNPSERTIVEMEELKQKSHLIQIHIFSHICQNCKFSGRLDSVIG